MCLDLDPNMVVLCFFGQLGKLVFIIIILNIIMLYLQLHYNV